MFAPALPVRVEPVSTHGDASTFSAVVPVVTPAAVPITTLSTVVTPAASDQVLAAVVLVKRITSSPHPR